MHNYDVFVAIRMYKPLKRSFAGGLKNRKTRGITLLVY